MKFAYILTFLIDWKRKIDKLFLFLEYFIKIVQYCSKQRKFQCIFWSLRSQFASKILYHTRRLLLSRTACAIDIYNGCFSAWRAAYTIWNKWFLMLTPWILKWASVISARNHAWSRNARTSVNLLTMCAHNSVSRTQECRSARGTRKFVNMHSNWMDFQCIRLECVLLTWMRVIVSSKGPLVEYNNTHSPLLNTITRIQVGCIEKSIQFECVLIDIAPDIKSWMHIVSILTHVHSCFEAFWLQAQLHEWLLIFFEFFWNVHEIQKLLKFPCKISTLIAELMTKNTKCFFINWFPLQNQSICIEISMHFENKYFSKIFLFFHWFSFFFIKFRWKCSICT